ncbi:hypothetical protein A3731_06140 [Roseovarius sp. HI0049]|nr:hypothetical protein A3731_06140 [Roseovarius sp. HI0049]
MSGTASDPNDDVVLAGEYTLSLLPEDEAAAFEARLASEPELRRICAIWAEEFSGFADDVKPVTPPGDVLTRVEMRLFGESAREGRSLWQRFGLTGLAVAVLAVLLFVSSDFLDQGPVPPEAPTYTAEVAAEDRSLVIEAAYDAETAELYVERLTGEAEEGRSLELWLIAGENAPVSLGVLPEDERAVFTVTPELESALPGGLLAISDEPEGGSPTGAPTGAVLATGPITGA